MTLLPRTRLRTAGFLSSLALLLALCAPPPVTAQERGTNLPRVSPNAAVSQTIGVTDVRITYGRPSVRGRTIYGGLVPYDEVWRTGANEATTITFSDDVRIEGQPLEAGTYGLFTLPGRDTWSIIFNDEPNQWGAFNYDSSEDVLRVQVPPESASRSWEMMTFVFEAVTDTSGRAALYWADTKVPFTITVDTPSIIRKKAEKAAANAENWQQPFQYAAYALQNKVLLDEALPWVDRSIALEENFNNLALKAQLLAAQGSYRQAVSVGEEAVQKGETQDEPPNGLDQLKQQVSSWKAQM